VRATSLSQRRLISLSVFVNGGFPIHTGSDDCVLGVRGGGGVHSPVDGATLASGWTRRWQRFGREDEDGRESRPDRTEGHQVDRCPAAHAVVIVRVMRRLQLRFDFDSTRVRRSFDTRSTGYQRSLASQSASGSHADLLI